MRHACAERGVSTVSHQPQPTQQVSRVLCRLTMRSMSVRTGIHCAGSNSMQMAKTLLGALPVRRAVLCACRMRLPQRCGLTAPHQYRARHRLAATPGLGDEELDVAVFRFTLGIPGFDDANIPRVVGAVVAALVAVNHVLGAQPAPPAQVRAEFLDILLAVLCFAAPELERRLRSAAPGRGRSSAGSVEGAAQLFALAGTLSESAKKELAWASFALLKNVNCCTVLLVQPGSAQVLLARGAVAQTAAAAQISDAAASLALLSKGATAALGGALEAGMEARWLPDRSALQQAGVAAWPAVPSGVQSALVQAVPGGALLVVLAERPRALSGKDQQWVAAVAAKLGAALQLAAA